jgi:hypothetical protein
MHDVPEIQAVWVTRDGRLVGVTYHMFTSSNCGAAPGYCSSAFDQDTSSICIYSSRETRPNKYCALPATL